MVGLLHVKPCFCRKSCLWHSPQRPNRLDDQSFSAELKTRAHRLSKWAIGM